MSRINVMRPAIGHPRPAPALSGNADRDLMASLQRDGQRRAKARRRVSWMGVVLALMAVAFTGTAFPSARLGVGGFSVHTYLVIAGPMLAFYLPFRLADLPVQPTVMVAAFICSYALSTMVGESGLGDLVKVSASVATASLSYVLVKTDQDYRWAVYGVMIAATIIAFNGLLEGDQGAVGVNPMEGIGNKNSFSLIGIPALALGVPLAAEPGSSRRSRLFLVFCAVCIIGVLFSTGNRGGWLGVMGVVLFIVVRRRSAFGFFLAASLAFGSYFIVSNVTSTSVVEKRLEETFDRNKSDEKRKNLVASSFAIAMENPFLGIGPDALRSELASRHAGLGRKIATHNVYALVAGGCGFPTLALLLLWLVSWWPRRRPTRELREYGAVIALTIVVFVWLGTLTSEILYAPVVFFALAVSRARFDIHRGELRRAQRSRRRAAQGWRSAHNSETPRLASSSVR